MNRSRIAEEIGNLAFRALLREVAAAPKPGLVDRWGSGSHDDMDFMTFADSALVLEPTFAALAAEGFRWGSADPTWAAIGFRGTSDNPSGTPYESLVDVPIHSDTAFLLALRDIGQKGEARMFEATGGVNTHKGALFIIGFLAASVGVLLGAGLRPEIDEIRRFAARIAGGLADRELPVASTHGAQAFRTYGTRGVRGEVEGGLPSLDYGALSILRSSPRLDDTPCVHALLSLVAVTDDTTVLHRGGQEALTFARKSAMEVLNLGGLSTREGRLRLEQMARDFLQRRISPGGSADLLSAGIFLVEVENQYSLAGSRPVRTRRAPWARAAISFSPPYTVSGGRAFPR